MIKQNKAITLIALIITIIVLLILSGVVINLTMGDNGIIGKVQTATEKYKNAQEKENSALAEYEKEIDNARGTDFSNIQSQIDDLKAEIAKNKSDNEWKAIGAWNTSTSNTIQYPQNAKELYFYFWVNGKSYPISPTIVLLNKGGIEAHNAFMVSANQDGVLIEFMLDLDADSRTLKLEWAKVNGTNYSSNTTNPAMIEIYYR